MVFVARANSIAVQRLICFVFCIRKFLKNACIGGIMCALFVLALLRIYKDVGIDVSCGVRYVRSRVIAVKDVPFEWCTRRMGKATQISKLTFIIYHESYLANVL